MYFDEREVANKKVALDLVESSKFGTMAIGESRFGNGKSARNGAWQFDEAVFGRGVLDFDVLRAPCLRTEPFSRYLLDGDFIDGAPAGNSLYTPGEPVCRGSRGSLRVEEGKFYQPQRGADGIGVNINPFDWHHYAATYNGSTAKLYIDEEEVASKDVALDLVESSRYSTMTIGEAHNGQTESGRSGVWLFDEAVFGRGVLDFDVMQPPCNPL
eukprot:gene22842-35006_t